MGDLRISERSNNAAHRHSVQVSDRDLVAALIDKLGVSIVAFMVDRDKTTVRRWAKGESALPLEANRALRLVYQVFKLLESVESDHTIRAWFIGMNPQLGDQSPAEAVRDDNLKDVLEAARAFEVGG